MAERDDEIYAALASLPDLKALPHEEPVTTVDSMTYRELEEPPESDVSAWRVVE